MCFWLDLWFGMDTLVERFVALLIHSTRLNFYVHSTYPTLLHLQPLLSTAATIEQLSYPLYCVGLSKSEAFFMVHFYNSYYSEKRTIVKGPIGPPSRS
jgi:hypothetical protein